MELIPIWMASVIFTFILTAMKGLSVIRWFLTAVIFGPLALLAACLAPVNNK